ncbi:MAG: aldehyde ferredoxin oxidoreductase N-terminal domain-containing protein [bacterium]
MEPGGFAGKVLHVDLTSQTIRTEDLDRDMARQFIGGWGVNYRLLWDLLAPGTDPLSPENPIVIGSGALVGTLAPGATKVLATAKFALPATPDGRTYVTTGVSGGRGFGFLLKKAGYDHVVITGRARAPVLLEISDAGAAIRPAGTLWGSRDVYETTDELRDKYGRCGVVAIGRAGENLCRFSMALTDKKSTLGRAGFGAIMGAKRLKAIVVAGSGKIRIADPPRFDAALKAVRQEYEARVKPLGSFTAATWKMVFLHSMNPGVWSKAEWDDRFGEHRAAKIRKKLSCAHCWMDCGDDLEIVEGEYAGVHSQTGHYLWAPIVGQKLELTEIGASLKLIERMNRDGICLTTASSLIDWVTRRYQEKAVSSRQAGGLALRRDLASYLELLEAMVERRGIGDRLAEGWFEASRWMGRDARSDYVEGSGIAKGTDCIYPARAATLDAMRFTMGITSPRGGHGVTGITGSAIPGVPLEQIRMEAALFGVPEAAIERIFRPVPYYGDFNVARYTRHTEDMSSVVNSLGTCTVFTAFGLNHMQALAELYAAATGCETTPAELKLRAERVFNLYKMLNVREGFGRAEDAFPEVWLKPRATPDGEQALTDCYGKRKITAQDLERLLDDYYDERGWDIRTGTPTADKLRQLGLEHMAPEA